MPIQTGTRLGPYEVQELLGRGSMGVVYRAHHAGLDRDCAVKVMQVLAPDSAALARFQREAKAIARLRHPNILTVHDYGEFEDVPYMVFEYLPGGTLADRMQAGRLEDAEILRLLEGVAAGLDYAHGQNLVHRDVKPGNVLLGERGEPVLADFGLVKLLEASTMTSTGTVTGTPHYMAPEQIGGPGSVEVGPPADRYALAVMAYELLTGHLPFEVEGLIKLLYAKLHDNPAPATQHRPELGKRVDQVLAKGMARSPGDRWPTGADFVAALRASLSGSAPAPAPAGRRRPLRPVLVAVAVPLVLVAAAVLVLSRPQAPAGPHTGALTTPTATVNPTSAAPTPGVSMQPNPAGPGQTVAVTGCCWTSLRVSVAFVQNGNALTAQEMPWVYNRPFGDGTISTSPPNTVTVPAQAQAGGATLRVCGPPGTSDHCLENAVTIGG